ncbi:MAG TPA: YcxB family protein [Longimicrobium sp.]|nr:YcxB family protein [Longimicrobium sp.]
MSEQDGAAEDGAVRVEFAPTMEDLVAVRREMGGRGMLLPLLGVMGVMALVFALVTGNAEAVRAAGPAALVIVLWSVVFWMGSRLFLRRRLSQGVLTGGPQRYTFSADGIRVEAQHAAVELRWPAIRRVRETEGYFLIFASTRNAFFVPKRELGEQDAARLRALLERHVQHPDHFAEFRA